MANATLDRVTTAAGRVVRTEGRAVQGAAPQSDDAFLRSVGIQSNITPLAEEKPSLLERAESSPLSMVAWQIPMLIPIGGFFTNIGNKFGKTMGAPFRAMGKWIAAPAEFLEKHTLGEATEATSRVAGRVKQTLKRSAGSGSDSVSRGPAAVGIEDAPQANHFETFGGHIEDALKTPVMKPAEWGRNKIKSVYNYFADRSATQAVSAYTDAHGHLADATRALEGEQFAGMRGVAKATHEEFKSVSLEELAAAEASRAARMGTAAKPASEMLEGAQKSLEARKAAFSLTADKLRAGLKQDRNAAIEKLSKPASNPWQWVKNFYESRAERKAIKTEFKAHEQTIANAEKSFGQFTKKTQKSFGHLTAQAEHLEKAAFVGDLRSGLKAIPENLSNMKMSEALNHGLYYTSQAATTLRTTKLFTGGMHTMKHMYASMTGTPINKVSSFTILFGKVPESMHEARSQFVKSVVPQAAANAVGMVVFHKMMKPGSGQGNMLMGFGAQMAASMVGGAIAERNSLLEAYGTITRAQLAGQPIPKGAYLGLMVHASKQVRNMEESDPKLMLVAQQYADEKLSAAAVMQELYNGKFDARYAAAKVPAPVAPAPVAESPNEIASDGQGKKWVNTTRGAAQSPEHLTPVGDHSSKEVARRSSPAAEANALSV